MIITKHYEVGITGKFQGRKFGTTISADVGEIPTSSLSSDEDVSDYLQRMCVASVKNDIKTMAATDPNFVIIQAAAQEELDKYVKYLENIKKSESKRGSPQ